jgi:hypothetical protein
MCGFVVWGFVVLVLLEFCPGVVPLMSLLLLPFADELGLLLPLE